MKIMIPEFPQFKKLEIGDEAEIRRHVEAAGMEQYSDYCFVSMWIWNTANDMSISTLHGNLVVMFRDYTSHEAFLSFIGNEKLDETAEALIAYSKQHYKISRLRLIPEKVAQALSKDKFLINSDEGSHDYVYEVSHLANMDQWKNDKKKKIRKFHELHPAYEVAFLALKDAPVIKLVELFERWGRNKNLESIFKFNEFRAFQRLLRLQSDTIQLMLFSADGVLRGFTVYEFVGDRTCAISHFAKADVSYDRNIYDIMNWEEAKFLQKAGVVYYNWEQDLGIPELRNSKMNYGPAFMLKKYTVDEAN